jgi:hypothetical protein
VGTREVEVRNKARNGVSGQASAARACRAGAAGHFLTVLAGTEDKDAGFW